MKLDIINNKGVYEIHGDFTSRNVFRVKDYFCYLLDHYYEIVMCLNNVTKIDRSAMLVLKFIFKKAKKRSKTMLVKGRKNEKVKAMFKLSEANYIYKDDNS